MPQSTNAGLRITPSVAAFYNYQISPPSVEAEVKVYAKGAPPRLDFKGFQSRRQREEDERRNSQTPIANLHCMQRPITMAV
jgi:hypothetical protein